MNYCDDPETEKRRIPALFAKGRRENRQAKEPRDVPHAGSGREARARRAILQARALITRSPLLPHRAGDFPADIADINLIRLVFSSLGNPAKPLIL